MCTTLKYCHIHPILHTNRVISLWWIPPDLRLLMQHNHYIQMKSKTCTNTEILGFHLNRIVMISSLHGFSKPIIIWYNLPYLKPTPMLPNFQFVNPCINLQIERMSEWVWPVATHLNFKESFLWIPMPPICLQFGDIMSMCQVDSLSSFSCCCLFVSCVASTCCLILYPQFQNPTVLFLKVGCIINH